MVNRPKGKLFALLAVFVAIGLVTATGAFTSVTADRTVSVAVEGDSSALLGLAGATYGTATTNAGGVTTFSLDFSAGSASGINANATTTLSPVITITNNAAEDLNVSYSVGTITVSGTSPTVTVVDGTGTEITNGQVVAGNGTSTTIGFKFDLTGVDQSDLTGNSFNFDLTITASDANNA